VIQAFQPGTPKRGPSGAPRPARADVDAPPARRYWCLACTTRVTDEDAAIDVAGAHRHRCVNPAGVAFEIGCFDEAPGCAVTGEPTDEATWFAGFAWSYAVCANCREHLGWCYEGEGGRFFGLILVRLLGPV
jgi:hypothetical protein